MHFVAVIAVRASAKEHKRCCHKEDGPGSVAEGFIVESGHSNGSFFDVANQCENVSIPSLNNSTNTGDSIFLCDNAILVYPFTAKLPDESLIPINDEDEYVNLILDAGIMLSIVYPYSIQALDTGEIFVINDNSIPSINFILVACGSEPIPECGISGPVLLFFNQGNGTNGCDYTVNYPLQVIDNYGVIYDINQGSDYTSIYNQQIATELIYPVNVTTLDGDILTFNSYDDICSYIQNNC